jgi:hypothetical protein
VGFFEHYWTIESVIQPGVRASEGELPEKASVCGITEGPGAAWVIPVDDLGGGAVVSGEAAGREVVAFLDSTGDVAAYEAPPLPVDRDGDAVVDAEGTRWTATREELQSDAGGNRDRIAGRHGLWFAFRTHYNEAHVLSGTAAGE